MTVYSKYNIVYHLQKWMDSVPGQTFLNYAYSWGASIVILGTLFKLTHLPGANLMMFVGMGTEVIVFFLSAFDRPFDKTQDGRELSTHYDMEGEYGGETTASAAAHNVNAAVYNTNSVASNTNAAAPNANAAAYNINNVENAQNAQGAPVAGANIIIGGTSGAQTFDMGTTPEMASQLADAQTGYLEELKRLTETLQKVSEQSVRLTRDSEEMENLNRTLTGICKVYEMQLKGASQQIGTIDEINEQSRRMAQNIEQLNSIYARMIEAMTVNMQLKVKE
ncbi:gliding motility protein GldL [Prevotella stercorea]|uniref:type IX secretion system motor protein PorL/GldL n=1 Tax=Leyella stercorea TaxID=363265 RepID=UPI001F47724F|nr:gliding motility protein GldL [Leyella stercorea]MCF2644695.1 gliding motility protein GldL [Leyella stercorea]